MPGVASPDIEAQIDQILATNDPVQLSKLLRDAQGLWFRLEGPQREAMESEADVCLYGGAAGGGKCLRINELCAIRRYDTLSPRTESEGRVMMREAEAIQVGDELLGSEGKYTPILAKSERQWHPFYRVVFDDGASLEVSGDHNWGVFDASKRAPGAKERGGHYSVMTTEEMLASDLKYRTQRRYAVPVMSGPAEGGAEPDIPAYMLGYWLGNGDSQASATTCHLDDAPAITENLSGDLGYMPETRHYEKDTLRAKLLTPGWSSQLEEAGWPEYRTSAGRKAFDKDKGIATIPWRTWSLAARRALLAGLLDSDGHANKRGDYEFDNTSAGMVLMVRGLLQSLGQKPSQVRGKKVRVNEQPIYRVCGITSTQVFRLPRKAGRLNLRQPTKNTRRYITSIDFVDFAEGVCFAVQASDRLYVAGKDYVVTHNTDLSLGLALTHHKRTLFLRREAVQLQPAYDRLAEIIGHREGFNSQSGIWRLPEARQIQFGGIPHVGDETKFQGNPRDLMVLDEVANMLESQVRFLLGWVRSTEVGQRSRTLMCSNPPTSAEGEWLINFFAPWLQKNHPNPASPGELRWFATDPRGKDVEVEDGRPFLWRPDGTKFYDYTTIVHNELDVVQPQTRTFIPSKISDNPFLMNTGYKATLQSLPEPLRSQMLYGDFLAGRDDNVWQVIPSAWVERAMERWTEKTNPGTMVSMGVDVSRGGTDDSIICRLHKDDYFDKLIRMPGHAVPDGPTLGTEVMLYRRDAAPVHVDAIGVGTSVVDFLAHQDVQVEPVTGSEKATGRDATGVFQFRNLRSMIYWRFREALDPQNKNHWIQLPPDDQLKADLCALTFKIMEGNVLQVIGKPDLVKILGRSTDAGDGVVYAWIRTPKRAQLAEWANEDQIYGGDDDSDGGY